MFTFSILSDPVPLLAVRDLYDLNPLLFVSLPHGYRVVGFFSVPFPQLH